MNYICFQLYRALSSVGLEHLVYTQGVGGSNPSAPTSYSPLFSIPLTPSKLSPSLILASSPNSSIFFAISGNLS